MNTRIKHTPGPWVVSDDGDVTLIIHAPKDEVDIARMSNDCEMFSEIRTNAHLIAAAPAMYEALASTFNVMENILTDSQLDTRTPCGLTIREWVKQVRAALAQAEGRTL